MLIAAVPLITAGIVFSSTRSVWIGAALGLVAIAVLDRRRRAALMMGIGAVATAAVVVIALMPDRSSLVERATSMEPIYGRLAMYRVAATIAARQPIIGYGRGAPSRIAAREELYAQGGTTAELAPGQFHNVFVMTLVEWGLPGLVAFLAVMVLFIRSALALRRRFSSERGLQYDFATFFLATTVVMLTQGLLVDTPVFLYMNSLFFFLAGLVSAQLDAAERASDAAAVSDYRLALAATP
jgi:O-antigen ligase